MAKAAKMFSRIEVEPLQARMIEVNDWLGEGVVSFEPYVIPGLDDPAPEPVVR